VQQWPTTHKLGPAEGRGLVVFLPGTWMAASAWASWRELFDHNGYDSLVGSDRATGKPAERAGPASLRGVVHDAAALLAAADRPPILIGLGIGALAAQVLMTHRAQPAAAVAIAPAPAGWVSRTAGLALARSRAALGPGPLMTSGLLNPGAFARAYASTVDDTEAALLYARYVISGSTAPLLQASFAWRDPALATACRLPSSRETRPPRGPLLVLSGGKDRLCPEGSAVRWTRFGRRRFPDEVTDHHVFVDRGHSLTIDNGWREVAHYCLDWLTSNNL
jgi:non-heme chloroperoxidase